VLRKGKPIAYVQFDAIPFISAHDDAQEAPTLAEVIACISEHKKNLKKARAFVEDLCRLSYLSDAHKVMLLKLMEYPSSDRSSKNKHLQK